MAVYRHGAMRVKPPCGDVVLGPSLWMSIDSFIIAAGLEDGWKHFRLQLDLFERLSPGKPQIRTAYPQLIHSTYRGICEGDHHD